ncbi:MAG: TauD/TfdA family dioxygenase [Betaproteobacteria bacterium]
MIRHQTLALADLPVQVWQIKESADAELELICAWLAETRPDLEHALARYGGVLLRGFDALRDSASFERALLACGCVLMDYTGGTSPRKSAGGRVYTATEVPGSYSIPLHQEMSYIEGSPARIAFFCERPAAAGGQTTVADMRAVTASIDTSVAERFVSRGGIQLRRNLPLPQFAQGRPGVPKPWTEVFNTEDESEAERQVLQRGWRCEWQNDGSMTLWQEVRLATRRHPDTGDDVWFNQVHIFAPAAALAWARKDGRVEMVERLEHALRENPDQVDRFVFADGEEIADADALYLYELMERAAVPVQWERGDLLLLDNILIGHGRRSFEGARRVLTGLVGGSADA